jgi:hypothetical protein
VVSGIATVNQRSVVSGSAVVNSATVGDTSSADIVIILDEGDYTAPIGDTIEVFKPLNLITGLTVGTHIIAPAALLSNNFEISYNLGTLTILPAAFNVAFTKTVQSCGYNISCNGGSNGSATANTESGGYPPYSYQWSNGSTTATATGLSAGTHTVTVTDIHGTTSVHTVSLTQPPALTVSLGPDQAYTYTCTCANLQATVSGGSSCSPYTYQWSTGATSSSISACPSATTTYTVIVTDANGCTASDDAVVTKPTAPNSLDNYVVFGLGTGTDIVGNNTTINGAVGHRLSAGSLTIGNNVTITQWAAGNVTNIGSNITAPVLYRNSGTSSNPNYINSYLPLTTIPVVTQVPCFPNFAGGQGVSVPSSGTTTLSPGTYGQVNVGGGGTLILNPGVYRLAKLTTGNNCLIIPAAGSTAKDIFIYVKNEVTTGNNNDIRANIYAQKAMTLQNQTGGIYRGAFFSAISVSTGNNGTFTADPYCYSNLPLCNNRVMEDEGMLSSESPLSLFPNPTSGQFLITYYGDTGHPIEISVMDMLGRVKYELLVHEFDGQLYQEFDLSNLTPGIYMMVLRNHDEVVTQQFVITQK